MSGAFGYGTLQFWHYSKLLFSPLPSLLPPHASPGPPGCSNFFLRRFLVSVLVFVSGILFVGYIGEMCIAVKTHYNSADNFSASIPSTVVRLCAPSFISNNLLLYSVFATSNGNLEQGTMSFFPDDLNFDFAYFLWNLAAFGSSQCSSALIVPF